MIIKCNDNNWSETERKQLLTRATEIYMSKRHKTLTSSNDPAAKIYMIYLQQTYNCTKAQDFEIMLHC